MKRVRLGLCPPAISKVKMDAAAVREVLLDTARGPGWSGSDGWFTRATCG